MHFSAVCVFQSIGDFVVNEILFFAGAIDKKGYLIVTFPSSAAIERLSAEELKKLIIYLASIKYE